MHTHIHTTPKHTHTHMPHTHTHTHATHTHAHVTHTHTHTHQARVLTSSSITSYPTLKTHGHYAMLNRCAVTGIG